VQKWRAAKQIVSTVECALP